MHVSGLVCIELCELHTYVDVHLGGFDMSHVTVYDSVSSFAINTQSR